MHPVDIRIERERDFIELPPENGWDLELRDGTLGPERVTIHIREADATDDRKATVQAVIDLLWALSEREKAEAEAARLERAARLRVEADQLDPPESAELDHLHVKVSAEFDSDDFAPTVEKLVRASLERANSRECCRCCGCREQPAVHVTVNGNLAGVEDFEKHIEETVRRTVKRDAD